MGSCFRDLHKPTTNNLSPLKSTYQQGGLMSGVKLLISGLPNVGKSTLIKDLDPETTLLISRDGKKSPLKLPKRLLKTL